MILKFDSYIIKIYKKILNTKFMKKNNSFDEIESSDSDDS